MLVVGPENMLKRVHERSENTF